MRCDRRLLGASVLAGAVLAGLWLAGAPEAEPASAPADAPAQSVLPNLRVALEDLARRQGVQLVLADAVAADLLAMPAPAGGVEAASPEASLRRWLNGFELVLHYGGDDGTGRARLKAAWVFPLGKAGVLQAIAGPPRHPAPVADDGQRPAAIVPAATAPGGLHDADDSGRLQALQRVRQGELSASLQELGGLVAGDASEAVRIDALEAYIVHPQASDADVQALLEQASQAGTGLLAEQARALRESRVAPAVPLPAPEPIEPGL